MFIFKGHAKDPSEKAVALGRKEEEKEVDVEEEESVLLLLSEIRGPALLATVSLSLVAGEGTARLKTQTLTQEAGMPNVNKKWQL